MTLKQLLGLFTGQQNVVTVPKLFVQLLGSYEAAAYLSQIIYWETKMDGEFYKSDPEWMEELCISESSLKRARAKLIKGFGIKTEKKGIPAKNYYTVDYDQLRLVLSSFAQSNQSGQNDLTSQVKMNPQDRSEWPDKTGQPDPTITVDYQETTQETTPVEDKTLSISSRTVMESPTTTFSENSKIRTVLKSCWMWGQLLSILNM